MLGAAHRCRQWHSAADPPEERRSDGIGRSRRVSRPFNVVGCGAGVGARVFMSAGLPRVGEFWPCSSPFSRRCSTISSRRSTSSAPSSTAPCCGVLPAPSAGNRGVRRRFAFGGAGHCPLPEIQHRLPLVQRHRMRSRGADFGDRQRVSAESTGPGDAREAGRDVRPDVGFFHLVGAHQLACCSQGYWGILCRLNRRLAGRKP